MSLDPDDVVASFDSASVLHAATVAALNHERFPHLGNPDALARLVRIGGRLPWPVLKEIYARIGGAEGVPSDALGEVDMDAVAGSFADAYPERAYPAVVVGSSNGALTHAAAAMQVPWLPNTVLVPVHRVGDPGRPDQALAFGRRVAPPLLDRNPGVVLHQMHDAAQDELMVARMTYFRVKWAGLPEAYERFLAERLTPGGPVLLVDDRSSWPVTRVSERHVFQVGGRGGLTPEQNLATPFAPPADDTAPEAEWGAEPGFSDAVRAWARRTGHPVVDIVHEHPQEPAGRVADLLRSWTTERGGAADTLVVPSFVLGDPWHTIELGWTPYWTFFPVRPALDALERYLAASPPWARVKVLMFQHGADSAGSARPSEFEAVIRAAGAEPELVALREKAAPHDIGALGRYGPALDRYPPADLPFAPLDVATAARALGRSADGA